MDVCEYNNYESICKNAVGNEIIFKNFKNIPEYQEILEHVDYENGKRYYEILMEKYNFSDGMWTKFLANDWMGNPRRYLYDNRLISPTTLRYIYTGCEIFNSLDLKDKKIVEIGGGYGGQFKIMNDLQEYFGVYFQTGYTIIDLPDVCNLQRKYLMKLGLYNFSCMNFNDIKQIKYDVCISNYAFGEFDKYIQDIYAYNILTYVEQFYIIYNCKEVHSFLDNIYNTVEVPLTGINNKVYIKNNKQI